MPNWCRALARGHRAHRRRRPAGARRRARGSITCRRPGSATWYDFARAIVGDARAPAGRADRDRRVPDAGAPARATACSRRAASSGRSASRCRRGATRSRAVSRARRNRRHPATVRDLRADRLRGRRNLRRRASIPTGCPAPREVSSASRHKPRGALHAPSSIRWIRGPRPLAARALRRRRGRCRQRRRGSAGPLRPHRRSRPEAAPVERLLPADAPRRAIALPARAVAERGALKAANAARPARGAPSPPRGRGRERRSPSASGAACPRDRACSTARRCPGSRCPMAGSRPASR